MSGIRLLQACLQHVFESQSMGFILHLWAGNTKAQDYVAWWHAKINALNYLHWWKGKTSSFLSEMQVTWLLV